MLFSLESNWYTNSGPDLEDELWDDKNALKIVREMKEEGYNEFAILRKLGYDPNEWIADWVVYTNTSSMGSLEEFIIEYSNLVNYLWVQFSAPY